MSALEGVHFREGFQEVRLKWRETHKRSRAFTTNLTSLLISKFFRLSIKAGKNFFKKKKAKYLSDVSMSTVERVP